jgi:hypothetical protein
MADNMKDAGRMIKETEKALRDMLIITLTMGSLKKEKRMAKEFTHGPTEKSTMVNGIMDLNMGMESGKV